MRLHNGRYQEKGAQVLGISVDSRPTQKAFAASFGGVTYPLLADFHPKGQVAQLYGVWNDKSGSSLRSIFIIDKAGVVRFKKVYERGFLPEDKELLEELDKL